MTRVCSLVFFFNDTATTDIYPLSLHDALPISPLPRSSQSASSLARVAITSSSAGNVRSASSTAWTGSGSPTSASADPGRDRKSTRLKLQSRQYLVCRLLLDKKNKKT